MKKSIRDKVMAMTLAIMMTASPVCGVFATDEIPEEQTKTVATEVEKAQPTVEEKEQPAEETKEESPAEAVAEEEKAVETPAAETKSEAAVAPKEEAQEAPAEEAKNEVPAEAPKAEVQKNPAAEVKSEAPAEAKSEAAEAPKTETKAAPAAETKNEAPAEETKAEEPVKRASSYKVTVLLKGIKAADGSEGSATLSYTVSVSGTKTISASTLNAKVATKSFKLNGVTYKFENKWRDASGNEVTSITINGKDLWEPTELVYTAVYSETVDKKVTVNFTNILKADGTVTEATESNTLSGGVGWTITQKKFDNKVVAKSFTINGDKYEYSGTWADEEGNVITTPLTFRNEDLQGDTVFNFHPVYNITVRKNLSFVYRDGVSTGSGSWASSNGFDSYTHTFKQPDAQSHYQFISWKNDETGDTYQAGDKFTVNAEDLTEKFTEIKVNAYWQPSVTVRYHFNGTVSEKESFEDIAVYSNPAEIDGIACDGWYDADGNMIAEDAVYEAPAPTTDKVERTVYDVYAMRSVTVAAASKTWTYDGEEHSDDSFGIIEGGIFEGDEIVAEVSGSVKEVSDGEVINKIANVRIMRGGRDVSGYYSITAEDGILSIDPVAEKVTVRISENSAKAVYDGTEKSVKGYEAEIDNELYTEEDYSFDGIAEAKGTEVGTYDMEISAADFTNNNDNFNNVEFVVEDGALTIEAAPADPEEPAAPVTPAAPSTPNKPAAPSAPKTPAAPAAPSAPKTPAAPAAPSASATPSAPAASTAGTVSRTTTVAEMPAPAADNAETAETAEIENAEAPKAAPAIIEDGQTPLADSSVWALLNLIMTIVTGLISAVLLAGWFGRKEEDEEADDEDSREERKGLARMLSIIPAAGAIVAFILTENMSNPMALTDRWTILMAVILMIQAVVAILAKKEDKEEEEDSEAAEAIEA